MIKEIDGVTYINETVDYTLFVLEDGGRAYICQANRPKPQGNVAFFRGGAMKPAHDMEIELPYITEADAPNRSPDGYMDDGTQNHAWICSADEWLGLFKLNNDRAKESRNETSEPKTE